jgi:hypothetical protein
MIAANRRAELHSHHDALPPRRPSSHVEFDILLYRAVGVTSRQIGKRSGCQLARSESPKHRARTRRRFEPQSRETKERDRRRARAAAGGSD